MFNHHASFFEDLEKEVEKDLKENHDHVSSGELGTVFEKNGGTLRGQGIPCLVWCRKAKVRNLDAEGYPEKNFEIASGYWEARIKYGHNKLLFFHLIASVYGIEDEAKLCFMWEDYDKTWGVLIPHWAIKALANHEPGMVESRAELDAAAGINRAGFGAITFCPPSPRPALKTT